MSEHNPLEPSSPLPSSSESDLEIRIAALVMGEASDFERAKLEEIIAERPDLQEMFRDLNSAHQAIESFSHSSELSEFEAIAASASLSSDEVKDGGASDQEWKLPAGKREQLLDILTTSETLSKDIVATCEDSAATQGANAASVEPNKTADAWLQWRGLAGAARDKWSKGSIRAKLSYASAACVLGICGLAVVVQSMLLSIRGERVSLARSRVRDSIISFSEQSGPLDSALLSAEAASPALPDSAEEWADSRGFAGISQSQGLSDQERSSVDRFYREKNPAAKAEIQLSEKALSGLRSLLPQNSISNNASSSNPSAQASGQPSPYYLADDTQYFPASPQSNSAASSSPATSWSFGMQMANNDTSASAPAPELALPSLVPESAGRPNADALALTIDGKESFESSVPAFGGFEADYDIELSDSAGTELALNAPVPEVPAIPFAPSDTPDKYFKRSSPQSGRQAQDFFDSGVAPVRQPQDETLAEMEATDLYALPDDFSMDGGMGMGGDDLGGSVAGKAQSPADAMYGGMGGMGGGGGFGSGGAAGASPARKGNLQDNYAGGALFGYGPGGGGRGEAPARPRAGGGRSVPETETESKARYQQSLDFRSPASSLAGRAPTVDRFVEDPSAGGVNELDAYVTEFDMLELETPSRRWESLGSRPEIQKGVAPVEVPDADSLLLGGIAVSPAQQQQSAQQPSSKPGNPSEINSNWFGSMPETIGLSRPELGQEPEIQLGQKLNVLSKQPTAESSRERARAYFFESEGRSINPELKTEESEELQELAANESGYGQWGRIETLADSEAKAMTPAKPDGEVTRGLALGREMQVESELARELIKQSEARASDSLRVLSLMNRIDSNEILSDQIAKSLPEPPAGAGSGSPGQSGPGDVAGTQRFRQDASKNRWLSESFSSNGVVDEAEGVMGKNATIEAAPTEARSQSEEEGIVLGFTRGGRISGLATRNKSLGRNQAPKGLEEKSAEQEAFSTFSLHVSDVSFKLAYDALTKGEWPDREKVRIEEFVNAFDYGDPLPDRNSRVACQIEQAIHPFLQQRNMLRVSLRTSATGRAKGKPLSLTLLLDNSGSMERSDRRATVQRAFALLASQLGPNDVVTLISFANQPRLLADRVSGAQAEELVEKVKNLPSEGGTNIEAALQLAMAKAQEQKIPGSQNRVVLLTDGAVNLGDADPERLANIVLQMREADIAFDAAGISAQDLDDDVLEALTRNGDGRYYLLNSEESADEGFAKQIAGALRPSAKNVKVQVEFNPQRVGRYKLLGFEKHRLKKEDFRNDAVDAAEMAAAEAGVAIYQFEAKPDGFGDIGSVSVRFRDLSTGQMVENRWPIPFQPDAPRIDQAKESLQVATSAALFAARLRGEPLGNSVQLDALSSLLTPLLAGDNDSKRVNQLQEMIQIARDLDATVKP